VVNISIRPDLPPSEAHENRLLISIRKYGINYRNLISSLHARRGCLEIKCFVK